MAEVTCDLSGRTRLFPLIGDPVTFVESPFRLTRTFASRGLEAVCVPLQVSATDLGTVLAGLAASGNVDGILVTMPHKQTAYGYCATVTERARLLGVISLMRRNTDGSWHGDMLDGIAFVQAQRDHGARIEGARALLVGAGGAGSAIAVELMAQGVAELVIHDPDAARVEALLALLAQVGTGSATSGSADPASYDLVFNASPLGMADDDPLPVDVTRLSSHTFVGDVISGHGITPLLAAAQAAGCRTAGGGAMVAAVQDLMADFLGP